MRAKAVGKHRQRPTDPDTIRCPLGHDSLLLGSTRSSDPITPSRNMARSRPAKHPAIYPTATLSTQLSPIRPPRDCPRICVGTNERDVHAYYDEKQYHPEEQQPRVGAGPGA